MPIIETNVISAQSFNGAGRGAVEFHLAHERANLRSVRPGIHAQRATHATRHANQTFHPAEIVLRAERNHAAEVGRGIDRGGVSCDAHARFRRGQVQRHPGKLPVANEDVRTTTQKTVGDSLRREQAHDFRDRLEFPENQQIGRAPNAERGSFGHRNAGSEFDPESRQLRRNRSVAYPHGKRVRLESKLP